MTASPATSHAYARVRALFEALSRRDPEVGESDWECMSEADKEKMASAIDEVFPVASIASEIEQKAPEELEAIVEWIECEEFYNLMQAYRHSPAVPQDAVLEAYRAVKRYIAEEILEDRRERTIPSAGGEYICKCGARVTPHRCETGTEF